MAEQFFYTFLILLPCGVACAVACRSNKDDKLADACNRFTATCFVGAVISAICAVWGL